MNSYPPELLAQLAPVMFVAGLDVQAPALHAASNPSDQQLPPQDVFEILCLRLRDALVGQRKPAIWQPEKTKTFQVVLVNEDVRLPPRKIAAVQDMTQSTIYHSPLSPLTPTSPLHPDGLIAPLWVRKHTQLVPSVFVLFMRLYESPPSHLPRSPLDPPHPDKESEERKRDAELAAAISQRKKSTSERSIKLTVVLLATRKMLDDPALDARLSFIRRQSGLDSRAALFVLSPVSPAELSEFIKSLQQALYDPAVEYYTSHSKRVRRKRNRHAQTASSVYMPPHTPLATNAPRPLRPEGWTVRYEYKMACFAEFRGEDEVALKHYQDAYSTLVPMFGSAAALPPRTKRWAEAKVLADCINIKICKLYLYNNEHSLALSQHNAHIRKFSDFSRGWGIGEETFEFWSWVARQQRVFAELLEQGVRTTLMLPNHLPAIVPTQVQIPLVDDTMRVLGLSPATALQHPGFFYYLAANSTEKRRDRFLLIDAAGPSATKNSPGYANEKKVDHHAIILDLYTKAYELFKKHSAANVQGSGRHSLRIAYQIACTYYEAGKFDIAIRFFERIAKNYRLERWNVILRPLLSTWYACAQQLGNVELSIKLLVEMLVYGRDSGDDEDSVEDDLLAVLKNTIPSSPDKPVQVDLPDSAPLFTANLVFWKPSAAVDELVSFQLSLKVPTNISISSLPFASLVVYFSHRTGPVTIQHIILDASPLRRINIGDVLPGDTPIEAEGCLKWNKNDTVVLTGSVASHEHTTISITRATVVLKFNSWIVELPIPIGPSVGEALDSAIWFTAFDPPVSMPMRRADVSEVNVLNRPHQLDLDFGHPSPACLDEEYPIVVTVANTDDRAFEVVLDVLLQPTEIDSAVNHIRIDEERSSGLLKGISLGHILPGMTAAKNIYLTNTGAPGDRVLDISIQSSVTCFSPDREDAQFESSPDREKDTAETLKTLTIATVAPIDIEYDVRYVRSRKPMPALTDLSSYEPDYWDESIGGEALIAVRLACAGPHSLNVERARLVRKDGPHARIVHCTIDLDEEGIAAEWLPGDQFAAVTRVSIMLEEEADPEDAIPGPGYYELIWRRMNSDGTQGPLCTSTFPLPTLSPPRDGLLALLTLPTAAKLHVPMHAHLVLRNTRMERSADVSVTLELDAVGEAFLVAGPRTLRVPALLPGSEVRLSWVLVPVECGIVKAPRVRVVDRRGEGDVDEGVVVRVVDTRHDGRGERTEEKLVTRIEDEVARAVSANSGTSSEWPVGPILVLP